MSLSVIVNVNALGLAIVPLTTLVNVRITVSGNSGIASSLMVTMNVAEVVAPFIVKFVVSIV